MKLTESFTEDSMRDTLLKQYMQHTPILELPGGEPVTIQFIQGVFINKLLVTLHLTEPIIRNETVKEIVETLKQDIITKTEDDINKQTFFQILELEVYIGGFHFNVLPFLGNNNCSVGWDIGYENVAELVEDCQPPKLDPSFLTDKERVEKKGMNVFKALQKGKIGDVSYQLEEPYKTDVRSNVTLRDNTLYPKLKAVLRCDEPIYNPNVIQTTADKLTYKIIEKFTKFDVDLFIEIN